MSAEQKYGENLKLGFGETMKVLLPYIKEKVVEQIQCVWFIIVYLVLFQILVLGLPIIYSIMISIGIAIVIIGLAFFMEGLRLGLMPLGEVVGSVLPRKFALPETLVFAFILGVAATFAEPAIMVLKQAGSGVDPEKAPLLYSLLNDFTGQLVWCVGAGVGFAVSLGVLRFFKGWSLKPFIYAGVFILTVLTLFAHFGPAFGDLPPVSEVIRPILGLAWDCGAVTTGPVTVPLVLALGIGVCRIVSSGDSSNAGFGVVTLASLFPILAVLCLGFFHYFQNDYYGTDAYPKGEAAVIENAGTDNEEVISEATFMVRAQEKIAGIQKKKAENSVEELAKYQMQFSANDLEEFRAKGEVVGDYKMVFKGGEPKLVDGQIVASEADIIFKRTGGKKPEAKAADWWNQSIDPFKIFVAQMKAAAFAICLLCGIMLVTLIFFLRERPRYWDEIFLGLAFAIIGMGVFLLGIDVGLTPLGAQLGINVPSAFTTIVPWEMEGLKGPIIGEGFPGKAVAILFAFILGYGATLAEPALNALGATVEKITVGAFKKNLLMQSVATGVGIGIATGIVKIVYGIDLAYLLLPPYCALVFITAASSEDFVNFAWDSAGVTTGPITVPLVMAMGLGIGATVDALDGFGVLALASVGPIISVLTVGLIVSRKAKKLQKTQAVPAEEGAKA